MISANDLFNALKCATNNKDQYIDKLSIYRDTFIAATSEFFKDTEKEIEELKIKSACLEAKIYAYEAILKNSNFSMAVINNNTEEVNKSVNEE